MARRRAARAAGARGGAPALPPGPPAGREAARAVFQDFEITLDAPPAGRLWRFARELEEDLGAALAALPAPPIAAPRLNDLAVQRYPAGSRGISAHRDHLRYRELVVLLTLTGDARLFVCDDRSGAGAEELDIAPGRLVLMRAPGFAGADERPFHFLEAVTSRRVGLGLRHDRNREHDGAGPGG